MLRLLLLLQKGSRRLCWISDCGCGRCLDGQLRGWLRCGCWSDYLLHGFVYFACLSTVLQQVVGSPLARFRVPEHVVPAGLFQLFRWA
jgi:hypothetical protein